MHFFSSVTTDFRVEPSARATSWCVVAFGGQTSTQAASVQCMHWYLVNSHFIWPSKCSLNRMRIQVFELNVGGFSYDPILTVLSNEFWFHCCLLYTSEAADDLL